MASTVIALDLVEETLPVKVYLEAAEDSLVAPAASGYVLTLDATLDWRYTATVSEALVGIYRCHVHDGDANTIAQGFIWIEADDTGTYVAGADLHSLKARKDLAADIAALDTVVDGVQTTANAILTDTGTDIPATQTAHTALLNAILTDTSATLNDMLVSILEDTSATLPDLITAGPTGGVVTPIGGLEIIRNDSYDITTGRLQIQTEIDFTGYAGPHVFTIRHRVLGTQLLQETSGVTVSDAQTVEVELSTSDTAFSMLTTDADFGLHPYDLQMVDGSSIKTIRGVATIKKDQTT